MMSNSLTIQKVAAALIGVAMISGAVFAFAAQRAHAVTLSELVELFIALDIISEDKADEARAVLDDEEEETTGGSMTCSYNFTRDLKTGATGQDVMDLQKFLNMWPETTVALSGAGSKGMETMYFGPATAAAVSKFQVKYAADILTPLGLTQGTGFFGASTRAKANAVCKGGMPDTPTPPGDDDDDDMAPGDDDDDMSDEEASLEDFEALNSPSNEDVQAGDEEVEVYGFEFEVEDGDVEVNRVDVMFQSDDTDTDASEDPWDYFETVMIVNADGDVLAEMAADDEDNWEDDQDESVSGTTNETYRIRFNDVDDARFDAGDTAEMYVAVTMQNSLDSDDEGQEWNVWIGEDGIRATDGAGLDQYTPETDVSDTESKSFTVEAEGEGEELTVSLSTNNPDASTIKVDEDDETDDVAIFVFDLEAEESDIEINELPIRFTLTGAGFNAIVSDVVLEVDGEEYDDYTLASSSNSMVATTTFDIDGDLVIPADEEVEVKVLVTFNATEDGENYSNGARIQAEVPSYAENVIDAQGADDLTAAEISGSATGDEHTLVAEGLTAEIVSTDADVNQGDNNANDEGTFVIKFDVTAFEDDFYVGSTSAAVTYHIEQGNTTVSTTSTASLSSTADEESNGNYIVREGETETFTLTVSLNPTITGFYSVELDTVKYSATNSGLADDLTYTAQPDEDFETDEVQLDA